MTETEEKATKRYRRPRRIRNRAQKTADRTITKDKASGTKEDEALVGR